MSAGGPPGGGSASSRRVAVLRALVEAGREGVSGEALAGRLGCSRASVHRHVEALRRDGTDIEGLHGGYRLGPSADPVVPELVEPSLIAPISGPLEWSSATGSTNDDVIERARAGAAEGLVIGADLQRSGRGRRGRAWVADPVDAVLMSVLLRPRVPPVEAGLLPIVAAVAVAEGIGPGAMIVWPNDILFAGRKVAGILCEMSADQEHVAWAVVGIGLNVRAAPVLEDPRWSAGALREAGDVRGRPALVVDILQALARRYATWSDGDAKRIVNDFAHRDALRGRAITVAVGKERLEGTCEGLDDLGRLLVRGPIGPRAVGAGEVTRVEDIGR